MDVVLGSKKGFVVTKGSGHGIAYQCSEPIVLPLSLKRKNILRLEIGRHLLNTFLCGFG